LCYKEKIPAFNQIKIKEKACACELGFASSHMEVFFSQKAK
jgi:hypothetical protein